MNIRQNLCILFTSIIFISISFRTYTAQTGAEFFHQILISNAQKFWQQEHLKDLHGLTINNKIETIGKLKEDYPERIGQQAMNVGLIASIDTIPFFQAFIKGMQQHGTFLEKKLYESMTVPFFMERLISKRPLTFTNEEDVYMLRNGFANLKPTESDFLKLGTEREGDLIEKNASFNINEYITYDEILLGSLLGLRIPTFFINAGERNNHARKDPDNRYPLEATVLAVVGNRLEKRGYAHQQLMVIEEHPILEMRPWLKKLWGIFLGSEIYTYEKAKAHVAKYGDERFRLIKSDRSLTIDAYFDTEIYKKCARYLWQTPLMEQNTLGEERKIKQFIHMAGAGLGGWKLPFFYNKNHVPGTPEYGFLEKQNLEVISDIFNQQESWNSISHLAMTICDMNQNDQFLKIKDQKYYNKDSVEKNDMKISFEMSDPAKLRKEIENKEVVIFLPWDSNSPPGNEYHLAKPEDSSKGHSKLWLNASADPAYASASTISELGNPEVNPYILKNIHQMFTQAGKFSPARIAIAKEEWKKKKHLLYPSKSDILDTIDDYTFAQEAYLLLRHKIMQENVNKAINLSQLSEQEFRPYPSHVVISNYSPYFMIAINSEEPRNESELKWVSLENQMQGMIDLGQGDEDLKCEGRNRYKITALEFNPKQKLLAVAGEKYNLNKRSAKTNFMLLIDINDIKEPRIKNITNSNGSFPLPNINRIRFSKDGKRMITYEAKMEISATHDLSPQDAKKDSIIWWNVENTDFKALCVGAYKNTKSADILTEKNEDIIISYSDGNIYKHTINPQFPGKILIKKIYEYVGNEASQSELSWSHASINSLGNVAIIHTGKNEILFINQQSGKISAHANPVPIISVDNKIENNNSYIIIPSKETKAATIKTFLYDGEKNVNVSQAEVFDTKCDVRSYNCNNPMPVELEEELGVVAMPLTSSFRENSVAIFGLEMKNDSSLLKNSNPIVAAGNFGVIKKIKFIKNEQGDIQMLVLSDAHHPSHCFLYPLITQSQKEDLLQKKYLPRKELKKVIKDIAHDINLSKTLLLILSWYQKTYTPVVEKPINS